MLIWHSVIFFFLCTKIQSKVYRDYAYSRWGNKEENKYHATDKGECDAMFDVTPSHFIYV